MSTLSTYNTIVRNVSGGTRFFGYLPTHGVELEDEEDYVFSGDLFAYLQGVNLGRGIESITADFDAGYLVVIKTPASVFYDETAEDVKAINLDDGSFEAVDPSSGAYSGSIPDDLA